MKTTTLSKSGDAFETYEDNGVFLDGRTKTMKSGGGYPLKHFGYEAAGTVPSDVVSEGTKEYDKEGNLIDDGAGPFAPGFTVPQAYADMCGINVDGTSKDPKMRTYKKTDNGDDTKDIMELTKEDRKKHEEFMRYATDPYYTSLHVRKHVLGKKKATKGGKGGTANVVPFLKKGFLN